MLIEFLRLLRKFPSRAGLAEVGIDPDAPEIVHVSDPHPGTGAAVVECSGDHLVNCYSLAWLEIAGVDMAKLIAYIVNHRDTIVAELEGEVG